MFLNGTSFNWNIIEKNRKMSKFVPFAREHSLLGIETSGLKAIFHWYAHFDVLNKSLFNYTIDTLISSTTENMGVLSESHLYR